MKFIPKVEQPLNNWSGGTTRQVWIFPEGSSYADRNFEVRISTATVEVEQSVFTSLPGYFRTLMVLEGELKIEHKDQHMALLKKFDTDQFQGEWETKGYGKCTDFNAMCNEKYDVMLHAIELDRPVEELLDIGTDFEKIGFYVHSGEVEVFSAAEKFVLQQGDFILIEGDERLSQVTIRNTAPVEVIEITVERLYD